eukprot:505522_1
MILFAFYVLFISRCLCWIYGGDILPRSGLGMGAAYFNNTIYIFGGWGAWDQLVTVNAASIGNNVYDDKGQYVLESGFYSSPQSYAQIYDTSIVYYLDNFRLIIYDLLHQNEIDRIWAPQYSAISEETCVTFGDDILYLSGSHFYDDHTVQAYNITNQKWITNIPNMQKARYSHSCVFDSVNGKLWVIGGENDNWQDDEVSISVETISVDNIFAQQWEQSDSLIVETYLMNSVYYEEYIVIMGGFDVLNNVQIISCNTGYVFMLGSLNYPVYNAASLLVNDRLYMFGGRFVYGNDQFNTFQYLDISINYITSLEPTQSPTHPTANPTQNPTHNPTQLTTNPTQNPTQQTQNPTQPTQNPTRNPTQTPTQKPTQNPTTSTINPTKYPTQLPSQTPTHNPSASTINPMQNPTQTPSQKPTHHPTETPSENPTHNPSEPTTNPTQHPTKPTINPTQNPTYDHTDVPLIDSLPFAAFSWGYDGFWPGCTDPRKSSSISWCAG